MLMPSIFGESLFDDFMDDFAFPRFNHTDRVLYGNNASNLMKTDVKETEDGYTVDIDLPGFKKDEIKLQLEKGYLTVSAAKNVNNDEKDKNGKYVRRERFAGNVRRSFYVGEKVKEEEIHPKFENGILTFQLPKENKNAVEEKKHYIAIE
ncbi:MAG: Hsp20/alpha crystallin family protein [Anaerobutyricum sp.]|nr:Hsp20/alpha crystallin family protein [Eubacterium sp.]MDY6046388.1 Hsp20/alpha crystallin family protein [Anaerobutyricum sp.]